MNIAIVLDHLTTRGGGERVALTFHNAFPDPPIFKLNYNENTTYPEFSRCDIRTTWFKNVTVNENLTKKLFFPLGIYIIPPQIQTT